MKKKVILVILLLAAVVFSCAKKNAVGPDNANLPEVNLPSSFSYPVHLDSTRTVEPADTVKPPVLAKIGASIGIAWPFRNESPSLWRGVGGVSSGGGWISNPCGGTGSIFSHSGADLYARDLSRYDGSSYGKPIYAGISGIVIKAGDCGGYGVCTVIYDVYRKVAVRYAHLIPICIVGVGQYVRQGQLIGYLGDSGNAKGNPHLHLVVYENVPNTGWVPSVCNSDWYACQVYFYCG